MKPKMRRNLPGPFLTWNLGEGAWRLSRSEPAPIDVFLRGADSGAAEAFRSSAVRDIDIEWRAEAAVLTMKSAEQPRTICTQSAIVHEPLPHLYEDAKARRFWRTVFRLIRIPGGRYLLGVLTHRSRDPR